MGLGRLALPDGTIILYEYEGDYVGETGGSDAIEKLTDRLEEAFCVARHVASAAYDNLVKLSGVSSATEYEVVFGVKLSSDAGVVVARAGVEASFEVRVMWAGPGAPSVSQDACESRL